MYNNILLPISFEGRRDSLGAIAVAEGLASPGAKITMLHIMDPIPGYATIHMPSEFRDNLRKELLADLANLARGVRGAEWEVVEGHAGREIVNWAAVNHNDLIVMASHRPGIEDYFLGATAARVVRHAQCSVHVLR
jgi:nucleotide-binding universal stress UspA family protein